METNWLLNKEMVIAMFTEINPNFLEDIKKTIPDPNELLKIIEKQERRRLKRQKKRA